MKSLFCAMIVAAVFLVLTISDLSAAAQPIPGVDISAKKNPGGVRSKPTAMAPNDTGNSGAEGSQQVAQLDSNGASAPITPSMSKKMRPRSAVLNGNADAGSPPVDPSPPTGFNNGDCKKMCIKEEACKCDEHFVNCHCVIPGLPERGGQ